MKPTIDVILGIQWGDEGKGRIVDHAAGDYDIVARFGGGDNAGHTIVVGDRTLALRIVPSGVLHDRPRLLIGGGTVVSLDGLIGELTMLSALGVDVGRIAVSDRAHIVFPYHAALDRANERARGGDAIGTTGRGIGPAYTDKVARTGITFGDLRRPERFEEKLRHNLAARAGQIHRLDPEASESLPSADELISRTRELTAQVLPHVVDGVAFIHDALDANRKVLIEGAQGTMLDIGFGTYPYVTSSHTIAGGACIGLGIGPTQITRVSGVAKAYCTRVGGGPFPSELHDTVGEQLRRQGHEFGTVTGRPRRCGWFDAVGARFAVRVNGLTDAVVTKLDVLRGLDRLGIVTGYRLGGRAVGVEAIEDAGLEPVIEWHAGWTEDISGVRRIDDLPANAGAYVTALERALGVRVTAVSVGPERQALAVR